MEDVQTRDNDSDSDSDNDGSSWLQTLPPPPPTELTLFIPFNAPRFARRFPVEFNMYLRDCFNNVDDKTPSMLDETELKRAEMLVLRDQRKKQKKEVRAKGLSKKAQRLLEKQAMVEKKRKAVEATTKTVVKLTPPKRKGGPGRCEERAEVFESREETKNRNRSRSRNKRQLIVVFVSLI